MSDQPTATAAPHRSLTDVVRNEQGRRLKRQRLTPGVRAALIGISVAAALGAGLASSSPTGHPQIDLVERVLVAVLVVLAASRARRWAIVIAAVAVAVCTTGWWMLCGLAALACGAFLILPNRRNRLVGAAAGGFVVVGLLHLQVDWFTGASTLVGVVVAVLLLFAGWLRLSRDLQRRWLIAVVVAVVLVVVIGGAAAVSAFSVYDRVDEAASTTETGIGLLRQGKAKEAVAKFTEASGQFSEIDDSLGSVLLWPTRVVPVLNQNMRAVRDVAGIGVDLTRSAARTAAGVDYDRIRRPDGGIDLAVLSSFRGPVHNAATTLRSAHRRVRAVESPWLAPPVEDPLDEFAGKVTKLRREAEVAEAGIAEGPALMGGGTPRRYLVLLGNPAEARDLGGHIGNWAEITVTEGKIDLVQVGSPLDLVDKTRTALGDGSEFPPSLVEMRPALFPQNWGSAPDLPTVAELSRKLFQAVTGRPVDGVLYADPQAFAAMVGMAGGVDVPGIKYRLTSQNAAQFVIADQFDLFPDDASANDALESVIRTVFDRITHQALPGPRTLADLFAPLVHEGRFQFASLHDEDTPLLDTLHLTGSVPDPARGDLLGVINRNANPSKIDRFLHRSTTVAIHWNPVTGEVGSTVTVKLTNKAPSSGLSPTVIGNSQGLPEGTNITDLAIMTPLELLRTSSTDGSRSVWNGRTYYHMVRVVLPPGKSETIRFELTGDVPPGTSYRLDLIGQPLVNEDVTRVTIVPASGDVVASGRVRERDGEAVALVQGDRDVRLVTRIEP